MYSGNYNFGANQRNSLLLSRLSCSWSMEIFFFLSGSTFKPPQNRLHKRSPHSIPPHYGQSCVSTTHLSSLNQLKTYHHAQFEKLSRKFEKYVEYFNPNEYKELAFIARLYEQGPDEEKIDKLLSNPIIYYRLIYTFALSNYYKSKNQEQKAKEYTRKVDGFEGYVYPLKRTDINEF